MARDEPRTGDGSTRGRKIGRYEVRVQRDDGSWIWRQTAALFRGRTPAPPPPPPAAPAGKWVRHSGFGWVWRKNR